MNSVDLPFSDRQLHCVNCRLPIAGLKLVEGIGALSTCEACTEMWLAAARSWYMVKAQEEWQREHLRRKAIIEGAD